MGYQTRHIKKPRKQKKVSAFSCYSKLFNQIKQMKCVFFIKRILFKSLVSMIECTPEEDNLLWLNIIDEWVDLCENEKQKKELEKMIRKMKVVFVDREMAEKRSENPLSSISKMLFVRYFLGMMEIEQEQYLQEGGEVGQVG